MIQILQGDVLEQLATLPDESVHCCVTSPPYWGLRSYLPKDHPLKPLEIGSEKTIEEYVAKMVAVFREVRRVLRSDGTLWLNLGDSYAQNGKHRDDSENEKDRERAVKRGYDIGGWGARGKAGNQATADRAAGTAIGGLKPKDLCGVPWRVAFALQADGWWLRQDIIWHKPNPMPESVTDRCTKAHEYIFLLSKSERYFFDNEAIKEPASENTHPRLSASLAAQITLARANGAQPCESNPNRYGVNPKNAVAQFGDRACSTLKQAASLEVNSRNKRSVWTIPSAPYSGVHFATFPPKLIEPCIMAGTSERGCCPQCGAPRERFVEKEFDVTGRKQAIAEGGKSTGGRDNEGKGASSWAALYACGSNRTNAVGWQPTCQCPPEKPMPCTVLDPFGGSGTTGKVAIELGRKAILIELNPEYLTLIKKRTNVRPIPVQQKFLLTI